MQESPPIKQRQWTPELFIQLFKELVCAALGIFIIVYTILMVSNAFTWVNNATEMSNAKDLLLLLFSLTGVVLGYYFGRVPADARTTQAIKQANDATTEKIVSDKALEGVGMKLNSMSREMANTTIMENGQNVTQKMVEDIEKLSDECRILSDKAHMVSF